MTLLKLCESWGIPARKERAHPELSAGDALHVAMMKRHGVGRIMSFDGGFDAVEGIERIR